MTVAEVPDFKFCQGDVAKNILIKGYFYTSFIYVFIENVTYYFGMIKCCV
jgi:hypothetical protein